jgi:hypothetical protein
MSRSKNEIDSSSAMEKLYQIYEGAHDEKEASSKLQAHITTMTRNNDLPILKPVLQSLYFDPYSMQKHNISIALAEMGKCNLEEEVPISIKKGDVFFSAMSVCAYATGKESDKIR